MSTLRVDNIKSRTGTVVTVPEANTLAVTGIVSVTSAGNITNGGTFTNSGSSTFTGPAEFGSGANITGNIAVTGDAAVTGGLSVTGQANLNTTGIITCGTLNVSGSTTFGQITGTIADLTVTNDATIGGNLTVNGTQTTIDTATLSVEDKNIGIGSVTTPTNTTANHGGITIFGGADGDKSFTWNQSGVQNYWQVAGGQLYAAEGFNAYGMLSEQVKILGNDLGSATSINISDGMVHYRTVNLGADARPNVRYSSTRTLDNTMSVGEAITVTIIHAVNNTSYNVTGLDIDGSTQTVNWIGGSAPSDGGGSGVDIYTFHIIKTAANTYTTIGSQTKTSS
jgi:hypothetical protein